MTKEEFEKTVGVWADHYFRMMPTDDFRALVRLAMDLALKELVVPAEAFPGDPIDLDMFIVEVPHKSENGLVPPSEEM